MASEVPCVLSVLVNEIGSIRFPTTVVRAARAPPLGILEAGGWCWPPSLLKPSRRPSLLLYTQCDVINSDVSPVVTDFSHSPTHGRTHNLNYIVDILKLEQKIL